MKYLLRNYFLWTFCLISSTLLAQSTYPTLNPSNISFGTDVKIEKPPFLGELSLLATTGAVEPRILFGNSNGTYFGGIGRNLGNPVANRFTLSSYNNLSFDTYASDWQSRLFIKNDGLVGINTTEPGSQLEVNGFTKLGSDAPAIKVKKILANTRSTQGAQQSVLHGLDESKILAVAVMVDYESNDYVPPSFKSATGYEFEWSLFGNSIIIKNVAGNSANILSKPVKILITYEE